MRKILIGVMGPGSEATKQDIKHAYELGFLIAENNWVLLSGGMKKGVMDAVNKGAKANGGLTLGILSNDDPNTYSEYVDIAVITNMKSGRNYLNALSSYVIIACGISAGTVSEIALALQANKQIILLADDKESKVFFKKLGKNSIHIVKNPKEAILLTKKILDEK